MDHANASGVARLAEPPHGIGIDAVGEVRFVLRLIHGGVGGAVDQQVGFVFVQTSCHRVPVGDIQIAPGEPRHLKPLVAQADHFRTHLAVGPRNQDFHRARYSSSVGLRASAAEINGSATGHGMARDGSFQSTPRESSPR